MLKIILIHAAILSLCQASNITLNVIHSPQNGLKRYHLNNRQDNKMGIRFEGDDTIYPLDNQRSVDSLIYAGSFDVDAMSRNYQYVVTDASNHVLDSEPFFRTYPSSSPYYEFYGRPTTQFQAQYLPAITFPDDHRYNVGLDRNDVHPNDELPTWHLHVPDIHVLNQHVLDDAAVTGTMTRISADHLEQFTNVRVELSGHTSRLFKKLTYSVHLEGLNGFRRFKLRSCATDPSYMREKLYYDVVDALRAPSAKASYVRLFINGEPQGLYLLVDHYKNPFFKNVFGSGEAAYKTGALIQGDYQENPLAMEKFREGANLAYYGTSTRDYCIENGTSVYKVQEDAHGKDAMEDLVAFIQFIHDKNTPVRSKKDEKKRVHDWNKRFDVDLFLKHLSLELLLGHGDGYMGAAHNYMLYQDLDQHGRFIWLPSDLDQTMGNTLKATQPQLYTDSVVDQFDQFGTFEHIAKRPLVESLLRVRTFRNRFDNMLLDIRHALLDSDAIIDYIMYLKTLIEEDVHWDQQLEPYRTDNFLFNKTLYTSMLYDKVVQLPLGQDFINRIDQHSIDFDTAIEGDIDNHPSITSLFSWFRNIMN